MIKPDNWIIKQCETMGMIEPFETKCVREVDVEGVGTIGIVSKGISSYGYDLSLSEHDFYICGDNTGSNNLVDVKKIDRKMFNKQIVHDFSSNGNYFVIPPLTMALGVIAEKITLPDNVIGLPFGKSTYSRIGLIINMTPFEPGWSGFPTVQMFNSLYRSVKVYANEGIAQLLFLEGDTCNTTYANRAGKYQNQGEEVTFSRI